MGLSARRSLPGPQQVTLCSHSQRVSKLFIHLSLGDLFSISAGLDPFRMCGKVLEKNTLSGGSQDSASGTAGLRANSSTENNQDQKSVRVMWHVWYITVLN